MFLRTFKIEHIILLYLKLITLFIFYFIFTLYLEIQFANYYQLKLNLK